MTTNKQVFFYFLIWVLPSFYCYLLSFSVLNVTRWQHIYKFGMPHTVTLDYLLILVNYEELAKRTKYFNICSIFFSFLLCLFY